MDDYLTRVAEAVRATCFEACNENGGDMGAICTVDLPAIIASVPRPEPVAWRHSHTHSLHDLAADVELADGDEWAEPLYAEPVAAQPAEPDRRAAACMAAMDHISTETLESFNRIGIKFDATRGYAEELEAEIATLRSAIRDMASMLQAREWAEHVSSDPVVTDLEAQITELVGTATKLREQNAALMAALKAIGDQTSHAGDEFGGPLAAATKEGLGDRDELLELAGIAGGYLESISLAAKQALASVKGGAA
ncbi:hypothetical protein [Microvirgula curvata]